MKNYKSGKFVNQGGYKSFQPTLLNRKWEIDDMQVISLLSKADRFLGRLDMYSEYVDIDLFIQMHIAKEATQSSKIEGTQTKVEEAFLAKSEISAEKRDDWEEVQNYIMVMNEAVEMLHRLPFSTRLNKTGLIKFFYKVLEASINNRRVRNSQNWIGGATLNDANIYSSIHYEIDKFNVRYFEKFANSGK